jgi:hypothetical protein
MVLLIIDEKDFNKILFIVLHVILHHMKKADRTEPQDGLHNY